MALVDERGAARRRGDTSIGGIVDLVRDYAKQETLGPLKGAGRWIGAGLAGALLLAVGITLIALGLLRLVQTEFGNLARGGWSWLPYLIVFGFCAVIVFLAVTRINKPSLNKERD
jgi:hypothetical protein